MALFKRGRNQTNVPRYGSGEVLKSRELIVLAAEAALANGHYEMAREQVAQTSHILSRTSLPGRPAQNDAPLLPPRSPPPSWNSLVV